MRVRDIEQMHSRFYSQWLAESIPHSNQTSGNLPRWIGIGKNVEYYNDFTCDVTGRLFTTRLSYEKNTLLRRLEEEFNSV